MKPKLSEYQVWLLTRGEELYPFSTNGFEFAQGQWNPWSEARLMAFF